MIESVHEDSPMCGVAGVCCERISGKVSFEWQRIWVIDDDRGNYGNLKKNIEYTKQLANTQNKNNECK